MWGKLTLFQTFESDQKSFKVISKIRFQEAIQVLSTKITSKGKRISHSMLKVYDANTIRIKVVMREKKGTEKIIIHEVTEEWFNVTLISCEMIFFRSYSNPSTLLSHVVWDIETEETRRVFFLCVVSFAQIPMRFRLRIVVSIISLKFYSVCMDFCFYENNNLENLNMFCVLQHM